MSLVHDVYALPPELRLSMLHESQCLREYLTPILAKNNVHGKVLRIEPSRVLLSTEASPSLLFNLNGFIRPSGRWRLILPSKDTKPPVVIRLEGKFVWSNSFRKNVFRVDCLDVRWVHPPTNNVNDLKPVTQGRATIRTF